MKYSAIIAALFSLIFLSVAGSCQTNDIAIRFIGNSGLYLTDGNSNIYVDFPYRSGAYNLMEYDLSELDNVKINPIFIFTHKHADHYSGKLVRKLAKKLGGEIYSPWNKNELIKLNDRLADFNIEIFKTKHRYSINHCSYLITWHNKKYFISGDTENAETLAAMKDIDWAFIPVWILSDAKKKGIKLTEVSKMFAVCHISPRLRITIKDNNPKIKLLSVPGEIENEIGDSDLRIIDAIYHQMDTISVESTVTLLNYIDRKTNNVEFLEYRAETLLKLLRQRPGMYLMGMCCLGDTTRWKPVLDKIESPISDTTDLNEIKTRLTHYRILKESCQMDVLEKTLQSIDKAIEKTNYKPYCYFGGEKIDSTNVREFIDSIETDSLDYKLSHTEFGKYLDCLFSVDSTDLRIRLYKATYCMIENDTSFFRHYRYCIGKGFQTALCYYNIGAGYINNYYPLISDSTKDSRLTTDEKIKLTDMAEESFWLSYHAGLKDAIFRIGEIQKIESQLLKLPEADLSVGQDTLAVIARIRDCGEFGGHIEIIDLIRNRDSSYTAVFHSDSLDCRAMGNKVIPSENSRYNGMQKTVSEDTITALLNSMKAYKSGSAISNAPFEIAVVHRNVVMYIINYDKTFSSYFDFRMKTFRF